MDGLQAAISEEPKQTNSQLERLEGVLGFCDGERISETSGKEVCLPKLDDKAYDSVDGELCRLKDAVVRAAQRRHEDEQRRHSMRKGGLIASVAS